MERIFRLFMIFSLAGLLACNEAKRENDSDAAYDNDDSKEQADEANDEKFEDDDAESDADFVSETVASNYGEIKFAQLATTKSTNAEVKRIANMLVTDHTKTLGELKTLAQAKAISIPVEEDDEARRKTDNFSDEAGNDFDKKWCKEMVDRHEETIKKFEKRSEKTEDAELKAWIDKTLPALKHHQQELEACHKKLEETNS